jgi:hypothetical protein
MANEMYNTTSFPTLLWTLASVVMTPVADDDTDDDDEPGMVQDRDSRE